MKRIPISEIPVQGRGGQGVSLGVTKTTGSIIAAGVVASAGSLDIVSIKGRRQRLDMNTVPELLRDRRGDRLVGFDDDDLAVTVVCLQE